MASNDQHIRYGIDGFGEKTYCIFHTRVTRESPHTTTHCIPQVIFEDLKSASRPLHEEVIERSLQSTHFRSVSPVDGSIALLVIWQDIHFENVWPLTVCKSASLQRISEPVVDVTSPHSDAHGDEGTDRMASLCPTNPAATITVDGIIRRMAKISNGYRVNGVV
jgi:hypothetical protein